MPFTQRPLETPEEREKRLMDLSDAFVLWASEAGLIDIHVDDEGEMYFTPAACEDCGFDADVDFVEDESFDLAEALSVARPAPHFGRHRAVRRVHSLPLAAIPVAAGVVVASTAYASTISHNEKASVEVTAPKSNAPKATAKPTAPAAMVATPVRLWHSKVPDTVAPALPVADTVSTGDMIEIASQETGHPVRALWIAAANSIIKTEAHRNHGKPAEVRLDRPLPIPAKAAVRVVEKAPTVVGKTTKIVVKVIVKVQPPKPKKANPAKPVKPTLPPVTVPVVPPVVVTPPVVTPPVETPPVLTPVDAVLPPVDATA